MVGQNETGNETYALGLLHGLRQIGFAVDAYSLDGTPFAGHRSHRIWPAQSLIRIPLTTPLLALRDRLDLYHATYILPPVLPCASVVTVHDISFALHPAWFPGRLRARLDLLVPLSLRRARRVIAISERTKQDIIARYHVDPAKITVTHLAPRPTLCRPAPRSEPAEPFWLYVGNVQPRKNVETIIRALAILRDREIALPLVIAGKPDYGHESVHALIQALGLGNLVRFTGYVPDAGLLELYATCTALLHPALYEGFGLTPLEGMRQGAPVVASNTSSIPEVVGDAGILVEPGDVEAWAHSMEEVLGDRERREALAERGQRRSKQFSWEKCARQTVEVYAEALHLPWPMH
jgi:glycosyltransferase involved in cell wall biosynthesis